MKDFLNVRFNGSFRSYQQNVLDRSYSYISDQKIHIVAAPGSGKTILGLELIRRFNKRALILSPSITIRQQWGERFNEKFLPETEKIEDYFSYDLKHPALLTSVTYQALHAAINRLSTGALVSEDSDDEVENQECFDYQDFDLIKMIQDNEIKTICLDEAHHLRSEWQKSLEEFITLIQTKVNIVALTATPPYDSSPGEWKKYTSICGDIDDEIFVPELVKEKTLCPHQDYIYFSYPTDDEIIAIKKYRDISVNALEKIVKSNEFSNIINQIKHNYKTNIIYMQEHSTGYVAILTLAKYAGFGFQEEMIIAISPTDKLVNFNLKIANTALQFIIEHTDLYLNNAKIIKKILVDNGLIERKKVCLDLNESLKKKLLSSSGKLNSISKIVLHEQNNLKECLRMLILTDFIRKDSLKNVGTNRRIRDISVVSIFESIRQNMPPDSKIAVLSGALVIVNNDIVDTIRAKCQAEKIRCIVKHLNSTNYSEVIFSSSNKSKVKIITDLFTEGSITILIGTKSLLGEGWDSPSINSLILASFVGSYMLANQMRGRAIRTDKNNPEKTSNIWHLATVEPDNLYDEEYLSVEAKELLEDHCNIHSSDFETLRRRFECFLAPAYDSNSIESGINRLSTIQPPFDTDGYEAINQNTLAYSSNRIQMANRWKSALESNNYAISETIKVPNDIWPKGMIKENLIYLSLFALVWIGLFLFLGSSFQHSYLKMAAGISILIITIVMVFFILRISWIMTPTASSKTLAKCILRTLVKMGEISSHKADVKITKVCDNDKTIYYCSLMNSTRHEQNVFVKAIGEFFSSIDNPRYLLIRKNHLGLLFKYSFSCPSVIGVKKEYTSRLCKYISFYFASMHAVYTRNINGKMILLKCLHTSYLNKQATQIEKLKIVIS